MTDLAGKVLDMTPEWALSLGTNMGLYFFIFAVGYVVLQKVRAVPVAPSDHSLYARMARFWVFGYENEYAPVGTEEGAQDDKAPAAGAGAGHPAKAGDEDNASAKAAKALEADGDAEVPAVPLSFWMRALQLLFCTVGLLGSYLMWGVLQERVMTSEYSRGNFTSSLFLVFCNRMLALAAASAVIAATTQPPLKGPHYKYSFTSLSNVLSSWAQLEALKYISFPTQVLAKSSKMIPVMIMGKVISGKSYPAYDYVVALLIGFGVCVFTLNSASSSGGREGSTSFSGVMLILCYLVFDSFTSQWQGHLYRSYKMSSYQMMLGVNSFSAFFTLCSLLQSGELFSSLDYVLHDSTLLWNILVFSITGATGQMFLFYTIKTFGPLVFTMIMTTRQLVAIVLSCIIYGHSVTKESMVGVVIVFGAVVYRIYRQQKAK